MPKENYVSLGFLCCHQHRQAATPSLGDIYLPQSSISSNGASFVEPCYTYLNLGLSSLRVLSCNKHRFSFHLKLIWIVWMIFSFKVGSGSVPKVRMHIFSSNNFLRAGASLKSYGGIEYNKSIVCTSLGFDPFFCQTVVYMENHIFFYFWY